MNQTWTIDWNESKIYSADTGRINAIDLAQFVNERLSAHFGDHAYVSNRPGSVQHFVNCQLNSSEAFKKYISKFREYFSDDNYEQIGKPKVKWIVDWSSNTMTSDEMGSEEIKRINDLIRDKFGSEPKPNTGCNLSSGKYYTWYWMKDEDDLLEFVKKCMGGFLQDKYQEIGRRPEEVPAVSDIIKKYKWYQVPGGTKLKPGTIQVRSSPPEAMLDDGKPITLLNEVKRFIKNDPDKENAGFTFKDGTQNWNEVCVSISGYTPKELKDMFGIKVKPPEAYVGR